MTDTLFSSARVIAHQYLQYEQNTLGSEITLHLIQKIINEKICAVDYFNAIDRVALSEMLMADFSVGKGEIRVISEDVEPWVNDIRASLKWPLWRRYKLHIQEEDPSFPIGDLDDFTDKILDKCVNPTKQGQWDRRGMVVGHVQSGKTSNYVGLINKSVDAGYKLIIIIAGTMNSLRRQTQERVDEGFIGTHSSKGTTVGVGKYKTDVTIYPLTSSSIIPDGDFDAKTATRKGIPIGKNPVVLVIKKNKGILENLIDWLASNDNTREIKGELKLCDVPTLIIDDEADSASVNTVSGKKDKQQALEDIKTINKLIRVLLNLFHQNTFIGYTATPYANLFIPQEWSDVKEAVVKGRVFKVGEDLFPRDFIINIKAAKNYIGAGKFFGIEDPVTGSNSEPLDIFRKISDYDPPFYKELTKANRANLPSYLPDSLKQALKYFILTCAIRRLRGHEKKHNSMLIHVALYVAWIDRIASLVNDEMKKYQSYIEGKDKDFLNELKVIFDSDYLPTTESIQGLLDYSDPRIKQSTWEQVKAELNKAASKIDVRAVHGTKTTSTLEYHKIEEIDYSIYSEGLSVVAVGGSRLARGITLQGLSISYYLRTTKMYDTLMQMGRWFGYRPGYVDLCRLFTTSEIHLWFNHITMATEEMRNDFDRLAAIPGKRPKDFKLKVRNHQGLLTITSIAKLFWSEEIMISFSGQNPQTYQLLKSKEAIGNNVHVLEELMGKLGHPQANNMKLARSTGKPKYLLYPKVIVEFLTDFLDNYKIDQPSIQNATLSDYIRAQDKGMVIKEWTIAIVGNTDSRVFIDETGDTQTKGRIANKDVFSYDILPGLTIGCTVRNQKKQTRDTPYYLISKNQIDDIGDRQIDLDFTGPATTELIRNTRSQQRKGLLLIYLLDPRGTLNADYGKPIVGFSLHFPSVESERKISYTSNLYGDLDIEPMEDDEAGNDM